MMDRFPQTWRKKTRPYATIPYIGSCKAAILEDASRAFSEAISHLAKASYRYIHPFSKTFVFAFLRISR